MRKIVYIFLFLFPLISFGQNYANKDYYLVDSLDLKGLSESDVKLIENSLENYHNAKEDTSRINSLSAICEGMNHDDWSKFQFFQYKLIKKALKKNNSNKVKNHLEGALSGALNNLGIIYEIKGNVKKSLSCYKESLAIDKKRSDKKSIAYTLNNIGFVYDKQGDIPKALEYYHRSLKALEELKDKNGIAYTLNNIGLIQFYQKDYKSAKEFHIRSLKLRTELGDKQGMASSYNNLGLVYKHEPKALEYHTKSLELRQEIKDQYGSAFSYVNIGNIYFEKGDNERALEYFQSSLKLRKEINDINGIVISLNHIAEVYFKLGETKTAKINLENSLNLAQKIGYPAEIQVAARLLSQIFEKEQNYFQSLKMFKLHTQMKDSIANDKTQKSALQQQAKYEYEKQKVLDDAEHDKRLAIEQEEKAKQKVITYATAGGLGLVATFLLFVFNRLQVTKKQKELIGIQRDQVEEAHKEIRDSIHYAERIQRSFLATNDLLNNSLKDYFVFFQPKDVVSGDFYWAGKLADNSFALVNADSTGHGVPGAIMSILNISSIEKAIDKKLIKPSEIFNHTRDTIIERLSNDGSEDGGKDGMDASIIAFDFEKNSFSYAAAQNPIWIVRKGKLIEIKGEKMPLGKHHNDSTPFVGGKFETQKGDIIYTITDGFQDQFGGDKGKKFKVKPFKNYLISIAHLPMTTQKEKLANTFNNWKGEEEQVDDVCVIGVRI